MLLASAAGGVRPKLGRKPEKGRRAAGHQNTNVGEKFAGVTPFSSMVALKKTPHATGLVTRRTWPAVMPAEAAVQRIEVAIIVATSSSQTRNMASDQFTRDITHPP